MLGYSNGRRQDWRIYLEASASKEELDRGLLRDYRRGEHQNSPHPFNFAPTIIRLGIANGVEDCSLKEWIMAKTIVAISDWCELG